jgi:hypothetical protein
MDTVGWLIAAADPSGGYLDYVNKGGVIALLVLIVLGSVRKWWVPGWTYAEMAADRDQWRELAMQGTSLAERQTGLLETTVTTARKKRP